MLSLFKMSDLNYIRIKGVGEKLKDQLKTIAKNKGITLSGYLRPELRKLAESEPERLKIKRDLD